MMYGMCIGWVDTKLHVFEAWFSDHFREQDLDQLAYSHHSSRWKEKRRKRNEKSISVKSEKRRHNRELRKDWLPKREQKRSKERWNRHANRRKSIRNKDAEI